MHGTRVMHGGYRVTNELLKRLVLFPQHRFHLTNTNYRPAGVRNIRKYISDYSLSANVDVAARSFPFLESPDLTRVYAKVSRYVPVSSMLPFVTLRQFRNMDVFHAPVDAIPGVIRRNPRIRKFFTALDLIPVLRPDLSTVFQDYTKVLYDTLTPEVNILAISECTKRDILTYRPDLRPEKIRVTYLAADKQLFYRKADVHQSSQALVKLGLNGKRYFLTVNSMARYKNVEFILHNFMSFIRERGITDLKLVVIGQNRETNYREYIERTYGSAEHIQLLDYVDDQSLVDIYNGSMGFLYMSKYEGFGLPILEAMQCGAPVICSNAASLPEVAGEAAILVDPTDNRSFVEALGSVYESDSVRQRLVAAGVQQASKFSWEKYAGEVVKAYEEM
jgi:glycosyltransferase involved in cell wall biosynthesis